MHIKKKRLPFKNAINQANYNEKSQKIWIFILGWQRSEGYGGYKYLEGYWAPLAKKLIKTYKLNNRSTVLDIGCGKGFYYTN